jgi:Tfp pilus assembly protein PilF
MAEEENCPICEEVLIGYKRFCGSCGSQVEMNEQEDVADTGSADFDAAMGRATQAMKTKDLPASLKALDDAIVAKPDSAKAWNNKAVVLAKTGDHENAIRAFERALEISPDVVNLWVGKGTMLIKVKRMDDAKECFEKALEMEPGNLVAQKKLAALQ